MKADFLVEIVTEELPPKALRKLMLAFAEGIQTQLTTASLSFGAVEPFATPRRLAVRVRDLQLQQEDRVQERQGPPKAQAFDKDGNPSKALEGFARTNGVAVSDLIEIETPKGVWMAVKQVIPGGHTRDLLPAMVEKALADLPIPKRMRWGAGTAEFVRPVKRVSLILGDDVLPCTILGVVSGQVSVGHRVHHPELVLLTRPDAYEQTLSQAFVVASFQARMDMIVDLVSATAKDAGVVAEIDPALVEEVAALVEWPSAVVCRFEEDFLQVPQECLISTMKANQKYFHTIDAQGKLTPVFIVIANIDSADVAQVREGNEKVVRPRLSDARFFWQQDLKHPMESWLHSLKTVIFQKDLGSVFDKVERIETLSAAIAKAIGSSPELAARGARLAKCDLMSAMVGEFPELQGIMGRYYALQAKEDVDVAYAIEQHYWPKGGGAAIPTNSVAQAVALADKLDTLTGIFAAGLIPTGDKDPFALRRAALGIVRICVESELNLDLDVWVRSALAQYGRQADDALVHQIVAFLMARFKGYAVDAGFKPEWFEAVSAVGVAKPLDFWRRLQAVARFSQLPEAEALAAANKRIGNILKKSAEDTDTFSVNETLLQDAAERTLWLALCEVEVSAQQAYARGDYAAVLQVLAKLRNPADDFFTHVMVNVEDVALRQNRMALLATANQLFSLVADIGQL
ncbi:MAG: glycine--tRNA ligase subunit beta [Proteobacteria bacterium]|nr:glycine--tRNA ligase subunit beta [Pseudomonadota bacterium]